MSISREEKEKHVLDLHYNKGYTYMLGRHCACDTKIVYLIRIALNMVR
jgi:hypothetical protein